MEELIELIVEHLYVLVWINLNTLTYWKYFEQTLDNSGAAATLGESLS
jgi:hypothetical protein